jgi:hypothetical protein
MCNLHFGFDAQRRRETTLAIRAQASGFYELMNSALRKTICTKNLRINFVL